MAIEKVSDPISPKMLKRLENVPDISQPELAKELGISLGWMIYCLKVLTEKSWVKANNFRNNQHTKNLFQISYAQRCGRIIQNYRGISKIKIADYKVLKHKLENLQQEAAQIQAAKRGLTG